MIPEHIGFPLIGKMRGLSPEMPADGRFRVFYALKPDGYILRLLFLQ